MIYCLWILQHDRCLVIVEVEGMGSGVRNLGQFVFSPCLIIVHGFIGLETSMDHGKISVSVTWRRKMILGYAFVFNTMAYKQG